MGKEPFWGSNAKPMLFQLVLGLVILLTVGRWVGGALCGMDFFASSSKCQPGTVAAPLK